MIYCSNIIKFNKKGGLRAQLQKKIGNEEAYRKFIEENHETDGDPFQEGNISLADLVQMEKKILFPVQIYQGQNQTCDVAFRYFYASNF